MLYVSGTFPWKRRNARRLSITAVSLFSAVNLPIAAVVLLIPINNITDMVRTLTNVTDASVCAAVVARQNGLLNDEVFAKEDEKLEKGEA